MLNLYVVGKKLSKCDWSVQISFLDLPKILYKPYIISLSYPVTLLDEIMKQS